MTLLSSVGNQQKIEVPQESWEVVDRVTLLFGGSVYAGDFNASCQQAFELAVNACQEGQWVQLAQASKDMAQLTFCWKTSLLNYAVAQGEDKWAQQLIDRRIDLHSTDFEGNTPLHTAAKRGACHLIEHLSKHIDVDIKNKRGQTPLHVAIESGQSQFVAALIPKGANVNQLVSIGDEVQLTLNALGLAVMRGEKGCVDELIKSKKCNLKCLYQNLGSLLHVAIYFHQFSVLEHLLDNYKPQFDIEMRNHNDLTPLSFAASLDEQEAINLLHRHGASINAKDFNDRLPIHHAAAGCHYDTIQLLASLGSKIEPPDTNRDRPLDLASKMPGDLAKSCCSLLINLSKSKEACKLSPTPHLLPPSNLVFRGGGPKGLAYVGVLSALEEEKLLQTVERVAGTSAGAITAALLAVNYPVDKLENLLKTTDLVTLLLDHPLSKKKLADAYQEATKDVSTVLKTLFSVIQTCSNPLKLVTSPLKVLYQCTGLCEGEVFREWLEDLIKEQTGIPFLTFGELAQLIKDGKPYKHLHVYGTKVGKDSKIIHIHSGDTEWKDVIISDAVRLSMAIPGVFKPHYIHIKSNGIRIPVPQHGSFLDGGMLYNFPVETFDQKQFFTREDLGKEGSCPKYNKRTIGLSLYSSLDNEPINSNNVTNIKDLLLGICKIYMSAEESIRQLNPYNTSRVIEIDVKDVGTLSFNMTDAQKKELVHSGKQATKKFLLDNQLIKSPAITTLPIIPPNLTPHPQVPGAFVVDARTLPVLPGLSLLAKCSSGKCLDPQQRWFPLGRGTFDLSEVYFTTACPTCNIDYDTIDHFLLHNATYSLKGRDNGGALINIENQTFPPDQSLMISHFSGWKYLKVTLK